MSAEAVGLRLLAEVQEESLDGLLRTLRSQIPNQRSSTFGVPALDRQLLTFSRPRQERAPQRPSRPSTPGLSSQDALRHDVGTSLASFHSSAPADTPARAPIVELTSFRQPSGKSNLLYYLTAYSILPTQSGGYGSAVVWLDTDGRFSAVRLCQVIQRLALQNCPSLSTDEAMTITRAALQHIHVFPAQSSAQLLRILDGLPAYLFDSTAHVSSSRRLGLIILDSATAFHWQDRNDADIARVEADPEAGVQVAHLPSKTAETIKRLKALQQQFECAVLFTTISDLRSKGFKSIDQQPQQPIALSPWASFATLSLRLTRLAVPQFSSSITMEECQRDQEKRFESMSKGRFVAGLDWSTSDGWTSGVQEAVARLHNGGTFGFLVTEKGVDII